MKKLDKLVLRSFVGPMALTFVIAVFVLLMQFIWKYVDDIAGKGLSFGIIAELLLDASATFVPMAMPIAVLFASIMTMGNMGEHYELVALKGGGIPLWRAMLPMAVVVMLLTGVAYLFADYVMPTAVLKYRTTLYDITRKKPALNIRPGEYYSEIDGFVIRVNEKDPDGRTLHDITIYDQRNNTGQPTVVAARRGVMQTTPDERYLVFSLEDGCSYTEDVQHPEDKPFTRVRFAHNAITFDLSDFAFDKSDESVFQGGYQMMNTSQLDSNIVQLKVRMREDLVNRCQSLHLHHSELGSNTGLFEPATFDMLRLCDTLTHSQRRRTYKDAYANADRCLSDTRLHKESYIAQSVYINRHYIEWHRKFTLSVACIVLFLVGAPFGSIVRKGGLGIPLVASVGFFVLYYVVGMIAEKAVREGAIGSIGMWVSTLVMLPIGLYLTYRSVRN